MTPQTDLFGDTRTMPVLAPLGRETMQQRHARRLAHDRHPLTNLPLCGIEGATCGNCQHRFRRGGGARSYNKCDLMRNTGGPGTDLRLKWPGCMSWKGKVGT